MPKLSIMIAGAQKSGTSSLNSHLGRHPALQATREDADGQSSEIVWFLRPERFDDGIPWDFLYGDLRDDALLVGKSAGLMYDVDAVDRLHAHAPDAQVVVLLRDPVKRAFSSYQFNKQRGIEPAATFEDALAGGAERFKPGDERRFRCAYTEWSSYHDHVQLLRDRFGPERVHVMIFEELVADPRGVVAPVLRALGLDPEQLPETLGHANEASQARSLALARAVRPGHPLARVLRVVMPMSARQRLRRWLRSLNAGSGPAKAPAETLDPTTAAELARTLAEPNRQLAAALGRDDLADWWPSLRH